MGTDVALVSPYPSGRGPVPSGVAWYTQNLSHALCGAGVGVTVIAPRELGQPRTDYDGPVRVERCFTRTPAGLVHAARAAWATGAPVVHVQHEVFLYGGPSSIPALLLSLAWLRSAGRGPVVTLHQVVPPSTIDRGFTDLHRVSVPPIAARAGLGSLQQGLYRLARTTIVHEPGFTKVVPGAVVVPLASEPGRHREPALDTSGEPPDLRAAHGIAEEAFVVLCFGFVAPYKGLELVLEAAELAGAPVQVVVAGDEHPRLAGQGYLAGLVARYGERTRFTGYVPDEQVPAWFATADVAALAYPQPFSSSGVQALAAAHGTPVLLSRALARSCGAPEALSVDLEPSALAVRLRQLASDRSQLCLVAAASRRLGLGRSWPEVVASHLNVYQEVLDAKRAARRGTWFRPRG